MYLIKTNINSMNAQTNGVITNRDLSSSLNKLSSGLRINKAADDASGMAIADSLRSQARGLGQAIRNANDAIGIIQIADKAMDEQLKILDTIRVKAVQSAQDGQTADTRKAIQSDITRLLEELDLIATSTSYNGRTLLSGGFSNKKFQIGAFSNQTVNASIAGTSSDKIGQTRFETGAVITGSGEIRLRAIKTNGVYDVDLESVTISSSVGTGLGVLAEVINKNSNDLQMRAKAVVRLTGEKIVAVDQENNDVLGLKINGVSLGDINDIKPNDNDARLSAAINNTTADTGVIATINSAGQMELTTVDGRGIDIQASSGFDVLGIDKSIVNDDGFQEYEYYGRLTIIRNDARDIVIRELDTDSNEIEASAIGFGAFGGQFAAAQSVVNLRTVRGPYSLEQACAIGNHASDKDEALRRVLQAGKMSTGATTFVGSQAVIDIADTSTKMLDGIRADLGSVQIQLEALVNNTLTTQTNVKFSESQIRDLDYSSESANFQKHNILAQAGNYALSQANTTQQNVLKLLQ